MAKEESHKFPSIIVTKPSSLTLATHVQKPREQIADAEALLDITTTSVKSVRSQSTEGITKFGQQASLDSEHVSLRWIDVGLFASHVFRVVPGCSTMIFSRKQRKVWLLAEKKLQCQLKILVLKSSPKCCRLALACRLGIIWVSERMQNFGDGQLVRSLPGVPAPVATSSRPSIT